MTGFYAKFHQTAERFGGRTAIEVQRRGGLETWTYGRLRDKAEELASLLSRQGVGQGDRGMQVATVGARHGTQHDVAGFFEKRCVDCGV